MYKHQQQTMNRGRLKCLLINIVLILSFCMAFAATAEKAIIASTPDTKTQTNHVHIIYSPEKKLHSDLIAKISDQLTLKHPQLSVSIATHGSRPIAIDNDTDIIISIGHEAADNVSKLYPDAAKLFIATNPAKFKIDKKTKDAILYMTQSYYQQIRFIKLLNKDWRVISLLNSQKKQHEVDKIQVCANELGMQIYTVNIDVKESMTTNVTTALNNSDVLLALPDNAIYNSHTVKNILLTSYRNRKPIIGFSENFAHAGALASVHSNVKQVADSATNLITNYFAGEHRFKNPINHPEEFEISINQQVSRALELTIPDVDTLKQKLAQPDKDKAGTLQ